MGGHRLGRLYGASGRSGQGFSLGMSARSVACDTTEDFSISCGVGSVGMHARCGRFVKHAEPLTRAETLATEWNCGNNARERWVVSTECPTATGG